MAPTALAQPAALPSTELAPRGLVNGPHAPPPLVARDIWLRWPRQPDHVLAGVGIEVDAGTAVTIIGANGVGKTTLLRVAAGLICPASGSIASFGVDPERDRRRYQSSVGFLSPGDRGLYARLTVRQQLEFWVRLALVPRAERSPAVNDALDRFAIQPLANRRVDRLSMGQRQRVRIALAFLHEPRLALLDEAGTSLDDDGLELLAGAVRRVTAAGGAVISCSPSIESSSPIRFDRAYTLVDGVLEAV